MPAPASPPPPINSLASRIQPTGVQAAGTTGLTADAGHVHASGGGLPRVESGSLGADVTLAPSAWTNIFSIVLPAGNWILSASLMIEDTATSGSYVAVARIADHTGAPLAASQAYIGTITAAALQPVIVEWPVTSDGVSAFTIDCNPSTTSTMVVKHTTLLVLTAGAAVSRWVAHETA